MEIEEAVFYSLTGNLNRPLSWVEDAFETGKPCDLWYQEIQTAYESLRDRLGVQDEDEDVEAILYATEMIQKTLCLEMFRLGCLLKDRIGG